MSFIGYQAQQVVLVVSDPQESFLSPVQSVLLFQRCRLLLACLQYNNQLAQHLRAHFREEFRFVSLQPAMKNKKGKTRMSTELLSGLYLQSWTEDYQQLRCFKMV